MSYKCYTHGWESADKPCSVCYGYSTVSSVMPDAMIGVSKKYHDELVAERDALAAKVDRLEEKLFGCGKNCGAELRALRVERYQLISIIERVAKYGPPQGERAEFACAFCDLGGEDCDDCENAFHRDECAVKDAQVFLERVLKAATSNPPPDEL